MKSSTTTAFTLSEIQRTPDDNVQKLARAMLAQAFSDALSPAKRYEEELREDALEWFFSYEDCPGSLDWVCAILQLDAMSLRDWVSRRDPTLREKRVARKIRSALCRGAN